MFIYALQDPHRNNEVRYIGVTNTSTKRLLQHIRDKDDTYKVHWIQSLVKCDVVPELEILEEVPDDVWKQEEKRYIDFFRKMGHRLTNGTEGGEGVVSPTAEVRHKLSRTLQGHRGAFTGKHRSMEDRIAISRSLLGHKFAEITKTKISNTLKGHILSQVTCEKISKANKGHTAWNRGLRGVVKFSPSAKEKIRFGAIRRWAAIPKRERIPWNKGKTGIQIAWNKGIKGSTCKKKGKVVKKMSEN